MRQLTAWLGESFRSIRRRLGGQQTASPRETFADYPVRPITTEAEWLASDSPLSMLSFLRGKASDRKFRLFAVGCCRRLADLSDARWYWEAVEVAERFADGEATHEELLRGRGLLRSGSLVSTVLAHAASPIAWHAAEWGIHGYQLGRDRATERAIRRRLLHDVFGNPFRLPSPLGVEILSQNDQAVHRIAEAISDERAFVRMPILGDALEDAGCTDAAVLEHCRDKGPHVRGCWVVDLVRSVD